MGILVDPKTRLLFNTGGQSEMTIKTEQEIGDDMRSELAAIRESNNHKAQMGNMHHVAQIPAIIVEKWKREGFDIYEQRGLRGVQAIMDRLRAEDLNDFVLTNKRIY